LRRPGKIEQNVMKSSEEKQKIWDQIVEGKEKQKESKKGSTLPASEQKQIEKDARQSNRKPTKKGQDHGRGQHQKTRIQR